MTAGLFGPSDEEKTLRAKLANAEALVVEYRERAAALSIRLQEKEAAFVELQKTAESNLQRALVAEKETFGYEKALKEKDWKFDSYSLTAEKQIAALAEALKRCGGSL